jgi:hypothetical protein
MHLSHTSGVDLLSELPNRQQPLGHGVLMVR